MSTISLDDVKKLATLSALTLSDQQFESMRSELADILGYIDQLQEVDTSDVQPTYQVHSNVTVVREDEVIDYGISKEQLLKNAPVQKDGMIVVPRVLE